MAEMRATPNTFHPQVTTSKSGILVDERIAPLIEFFWGEGLNTFYSCEGDTEPSPMGRRDAYILFDSKDHLEEILKANSIEFFNEKLEGSAGRTIRLKTSIWRRPFYSTIIHESFAGDRFRFTMHPDEVAWFTDRLCKGV